MIDNVNHEVMESCWGFNCVTEGMRNIQVNESEDFW